MIYHLLQSKLYFILRRKPFLLVSTIVGCADITALAFDMIFASRIGCAKWCTESHQIKIKSPVCKFRIFTYCYDFRFSSVCMCDLNRNAVQYNSKKNNEFFISDSRPEWSPDGRFFPTSHNCPQIISHITFTSENLLSTVLDQLLRRKDFQKVCTVISLQPERRKLQILTLILTVKTNSSHRQKNRWSENAAAPIQRTVPGYRSDYPTWNYTNCEDHFFQIPSELSLKSGTCQLKSKLLSHFTGLGLRSYRGTIQLKRLSQQLNRTNIGRD